MSYAKYGLTPTNASASNLDKGIVEGGDGRFYQIDGFKHGQEDGLDKDKATKAFNGELEAAGRAAGFDPSNFNTAGDVQNAIQALGTPKRPEIKKDEPDEMEMSPEYAEAKARITQYQEDVASGRTAEELYGNAPDSTSFLDRYRLKLGERLANGNYRPPKLKDVATKSEDKEPVQ